MTLHKISSEYCIEIGFVFGVMLPEGLYHRGTIVDFRDGVFLADLKPINEYIEGSEVIRTPILIGKDKGNYTAKYNIYEFLLWTEKMCIASIRPKDFDAFDYKGCTWLSKNGIDWKEYKPKF